MASVVQECQFPWQLFHYLQFVFHIHDDQGSCSDTVAHTLTSDELMLVKFPLKQEKTTEL